MSTDSDIQLIVRGDDFGMCHAVNQGIQRAFTDGIVTMSSTMAPCPWFGEAAEIAKDIGIPLGAHQTLTCESTGSTRPDCASIISTTTWVRFCLPPISRWRSRPASRSFMPTTCSADWQASASSARETPRLRRSGYRISDLAVVTDPEVRELINELGIRLR